MADEVRERLLSTSALVAAGLLASYPYELSVQIAAGRCLYQFFQYKGRDFLNRAERDWRR